MSATLLSWLAAFIVIFGLNGLFHTFVAAGFYDPHLSGITLPMAKANPVFVALVDAVLVAVMAYFTLRTRAQPVERLDAAKTGALVGLVGSWTYNLINSALIPGWPVVGTILDIFWHVALGAVGGVLMAGVYNALAGKSKRSAVRN